MLKPFSLHGLSSLSLSLILTLSSSLCLSQQLLPLSHLSCSKLASVLGFGFWRLDRWIGISWSVGLNWWIYWSIGGSVGLIVSSFVGFAFGLGLIVCFWWIGLVWVWLFPMVDRFGLIVCFWFGFDRLAGLALDILRPKTRTKNWAL